MGIAVSIVSAVLKSVVEDKLGSGLVKDLIGISIEGISEKGINEITDFINRGKSKIDSILSNENMKSMGIPEDKIDFVVAEIKDLLSKISITDEVLRQCKYDSMNLSVFLWDNYRECKNDYIESESEIKRCLFGVAEALIKLVRESESFEKDVLIQISNSVDEMRIEAQIDSQNIMRKLDRLEESNQAIYHKVSVNSYVKNIEQKIIKSRTQEYADKWDANMFLNDFNKRDENAGINIKLSEIYLEKHLPHYIWGSNKRIEFDLQDLLSEYVYNYDENKMLVILGQPGIGKSTLVTWIVANFLHKINDILVYKFVPDLKDVDWINTQFEFSVADQILSVLHLSFEDLKGKTLIIDGFDEISVGENREKVLNRIYWQLIKGGVDGFSLIVTCRENYIRDLDKLECTYITLQTWNEIQITSFCKVFKEKSKNNISEWMIKRTIENKEVFGIPLILYMVVALNISIEKEGSIVDVYDKIFSLEGGIYDRCINNKRFAEKHRIGVVKKQIHQISRNIALWMFENNSEEASIPQENYQEICNYVVIHEQQEKREIESDFLIGNFFKLVKHCEGVESEELYFVHRTIYEYFVAEIICRLMEKTMQVLSDESQEELARNIARYLKKGQITPTIGEYIQYKIMKLYDYNLWNSEKRDRVYQWLENTVSKMMRVGMFYYTKESMYYRNVIAKECQCFMNLVEILRLLLDTSEKKYIMENVERDLLERYIHHCVTEKTVNLNLSKMSLDEINLKGIDLQGVNISKASLNKINLSKSCLCKADLSGSYCYGANLEGADLNDAKLQEAKLEKANMRWAELSNINLQGADLKEADLHRSDLSAGKLCRAKLCKANLVKVDLIGTDLTEADLKEADLFGASLCNATFKKAVLNASIWGTQDIQQIYSELRNTTFEYIIIEIRYRIKKKIFRAEIFPDEQ